MSDDSKKLADFKFLEEDQVGNYQGGIVKGEIDSTRPIEQQRPEEGAGVAVVRTEQVWSTNAETGELEDVLFSRTGIRHLPKEDSELIKAQLYGEGMAVEALGMYFLD